MSDFVAYEPKVTTSAADGVVDIRLAGATDIGTLAGVLAVRGGTAEEHVERARRMIETLDILLVAEKDKTVVGWCGIQKYSIQPGASPKWLIAGLTVVPEARRQGIAARLLRQLVRDTSRTAPGEPIFSVINAMNLASIDLHLKLGFLEVGRSASYAGITFTGGEGVLLRIG